MRKKIVGIISLLIFSTQAYSWNAVGHMVVAKIAYEKLNPDVRDKVDTIVSLLSTEYPSIQNFVQTASWADQLRGQKIESYTHWHYVDNAFSTDGTSLKNLKDTDNAVWAIEKIIPVVKNNHANPFERARFLAFLVHIVGDIHQPLHTVSRISIEHPDGDQGGNLFLVDYKVKNNQQMSNLHRIWDGGLGLFEKESSSDNIDMLAKTITKTYPESYFGEQVNDINQNDWADEGVKTSTHFVYQIQEGTRPSSHYILEGQEQVKKKVALAGYRLALLLNSIL